jgi:hypothetical protein
VWKARKATESPPKRMMTAAKSKITRPEEKERTPTHKEKSKEKPTSSRPEKKQIKETTLLESYDNKKVLYLYYNYNTNKNGKIKRLLLYLFKCNGLYSYKNF